MKVVNLTGFTVFGSPPPGSARREVRTYERQHEYREKADVHPCPL